MAHERTAVIDFGSQYTHLIARRVRDLGVYSEIIPCRVSAAEIEESAPTGIILSGGPASVYEEGAPGIDAAILDLGIPVLGICYGMQVSCAALGGEIDSAPSREYGGTRLRVGDPGELLNGLGGELTVWMSHGDIVTGLSGDFVPLAATANSPCAAVRHKDKPIWGLQFHPEVHHTPKGSEILRNFLYGICGAKGEWRIASFAENAVTEIKKKVPAGDRVVIGLSGGVDSSVAAALIHRAIGDRLEAVYVDTGMMRLGETDALRRVFAEHFKMKVRIVDARSRFLDGLTGVTDPEEKRKIIGREFIDVFREEAAKIPGVGFLAQGTIYPDIIESRSPTGGPSAMIKSHHNVGGLPDVLGFELLEPLRDLFKDEVRAVGESIGLDDELLYRQPFPGPGFAVRIVGEVTPERVRIVGEADAIIIGEVKKAGLYRKLWQSFAILLPVRSVGVMGDKRTYEYTIAIRAVESVDAMTADWAALPDEVLRTISNRIINEVKGVNRVVYDVSSKPPATIEWE